MTNAAAAARAAAMAARSFSIAAPVPSTSEEIVGFETTETPSNPSSTCTTLATA